MMLDTFYSKYTEAQNEEGGLIYGRLSSTIYITWTDTTWDESIALLDAGMVWLYGTNIDFYILRMLLKKTTSSTMNAGGFYFCNIGYTNL